MKKKRTGLSLTPVLVLIGFAGAPTGALAQQDLAAARACTTISTDAERLACYDRALRSGGAEGARSARIESSPPARNEPSPPARSASLPPVSSESPPPSKSIAAVPREAAAEREPPAHRTAPKASTGDKGEFEVTVVEVRRPRRVAEAFFVTDDGRVWRQTDDKQIQFPATPFRAVISSGFLGSHFLAPVGERISVRVSEDGR